jgi:hypothetical protein
MSTKLAGFREPGLRTAGKADAGGGGGSSAAIDISITDAGGYYTSTNVEGALQEAFAAVNLRAKLSDLASTAVGKGASLIGTSSADLMILGVHPTVEDSLVSISDTIDQVVTNYADTSNGQGASLIGIEDAGGHYTSTNVEGALAEAGASIATNTANIATNTTAIGLRPLTTDLASHATGKGASTIGIEDAGNFYTTDNVEAALAQLGPLLAAGTPTSLTATLTDAGTTTAPDLINIAHRSSGTPAANFGLTVARELDSSAKTRRRALAEVTKWTTATDGAETASHTFQLRLAGTLTDTLSLSPTTSNFPINGSNSVPTLTVGTPGDLIGFYRSSSQELGIAAGGTRLGRWFTGSPGALQADTIFIGPVGTAAAPTYTVNGSTGGSGLFGATDQVLASVTGTQVLTMSKRNSAFVYTAPTPSASFTASTETVGFDVAMSRTATWATGALTTQREMLVRKPTYAFLGASTITTAATLAIEGVPVAGSNATITNAYSLWTQAGTVRFDLSDAATTTAPDGIVRRHTTSGTVANGYGITDAIEIPSSTGTNRRAMTDATTWQQATDGSEYAQRVISLMGAGSMTQALAVSWSAPSLLLTLGTNGLRSTGSTSFDLLIGGTQFLSCVSTTGVVLPFRLCTNKGANVASATTVTLGTGGNYFVITGTTTIQGIVTTNWQNGTRVSVELPSGITVKHNSGAPGASAVAILLRAGVDLVTSGTYLLDLCFNGTNWVQPS